MAQVQLDLSHRRPAVNRSGRSCFVGARIYRADEAARFTLRTHTHLLPGSEGRTRKAIDEAFRAEEADEETEE
ncbi:hypothetical protein Aple_038260 [Acrocarpospora pleiomorpha]|uniref:Uncharacterized protein n=1 Tax=Acrocarpospora pleiomorpha TaxID=90975 RepID=A0A5M3XIY9_9ACTN|nr:hypothetical protein [Acrocarpospora pleiomorpha]GES20930.1 hypothetical protein Aple_038260 [Acrocarpospora pleiomorpha]